MNFASVLLSAAVLAAQVEPDLAAEHSPFKEEVSGQRELTLDTTETQEDPEPGGRHISEKQRVRLLAIMHGAQKVADSGAPTDDELRAHVRKLGYKDERYIPNDRAIYDAICDFGGGKKLKVNGKK